jgi:MATE family multidrug resistance protein
MALAVPIIGSNLALMLLHVTDTLVLGRYGTDELAAGVLAMAFFFFLFILGSGIGIALMGMIAASLGRGDETQVRRETRMGLWLTTLYGLLAAPVLVFSAPLLVALGQEPDLSAMAQDYLRIAAFGLAPSLLVVVLRSFFSAIERAGVVLWVTLAGLVVNAVLNWMFVFGNLGAPEMGLRGSAVATTATQIMQVLLLAAFAAWMPPARRFRLFQRLWRPDWSAFRQVMRLGAPAGLTLLAESGLFSAAALMMGWVGRIELAAHGIALQVSSVAFMAYLGLSNAATVRVGRAHGEENRAQLREVALVAVALTSAFVVINATLFLTAARPILRLFLNTSDAEAAAILDFGVALMAVGAAFQLFDAMQVAALGLLRGVQDARVPMWLAVPSYWLIGIPASYALAFGLGMGGIGVWWGMVIGLAAASGLLMLRFWRGAWVASAPTYASSVV